MIPINIKDMELTGDTQERSRNGRRSVVACKHLCYAGTSRRNGMAVNWIVTAEQPVSKFATEEQKEQWLPPLISGQSRACFDV